jgi:AraC-like DNA-binding protein
MLATGGFAPSMMLPAWSPGERVWFERPAGLSGVEVMRARSSARPWRVWHEHYTLALIRGVQHFGQVGGSECRYRGEELLIVPGIVMLMEPGECHITRRVSAAGDFDAFQLSPEFVEQAALRAGLRTPVHLQTAWTTDPQLLSALQRLADSIESPAGQALLQQELLEHILARLFTRYAESRATSQRHPICRLSRVREYIVEHHAEDFDLDALSAACGVSKSTISHLMPKELGVTPSAFRTMVRVSHAQRLLAQGLPAGDVALRVGFYDQAQLIKHVKNAVGVTPARYAKMIGR